MYLLRVLQRIIYNKLDKPENEGLPDLSPRELAVLIPLIVCIFWIGLYPRPFLKRMEASSRALVEQVRGTPPADAVQHAGAAAPGVER
jgi:NADH-quinone oxidoreductase subunit M